MPTSDAPIATLSRRRVRRRLGRRPRRCLHHQSRSRDVPPLISLSSATSKVSRVADLAGRPAPWHGPPTITADGRRLVYPPARPDCKRHHAGRTVQVINLPSLVRSRLLYIHMSLAGRIVALGKGQGSNLSPPPHPPPLPPPPRGLNRGQPHTKPQ